MRLLEIRADPLAHFFPTKTTPDGTFFFAGPPGLVPELAEMFMFESKPLIQKRRGASPAGRAAKRPRLEEEEDIEEVAASRHPLRQ